MFYLTYFDQKSQFHISAFNYPNIVQIKINISKSNIISMNIRRLEKISDN